MATNYKLFTKMLRGLLGHAETPTTRDIEARVGMSVGQVTLVPNNVAHASGTAALTFVNGGLVFAANRPCRLVGAKYRFDTKPTVSNTDHFVLTLVKKKAPTFSLTFEMARIVGSTTSTFLGYLPSTLVAGGAYDFALSSLSTEFKLAVGDTVQIVKSFVGGIAGSGQLFTPKGSIIAEFA